MPERLAITLFGLKIVQILSPLSILLLAAVAPRHIYFPVGLLGIAAAIIAGVVIVEGLAQGRLLTRSGAVARKERPVGFWGLMALNVFALILGLGLTQLWRLTQ